MVGKQSNGKSFASVSMESPAPTNKELILWQDWQERLNSYKLTKRKKEETS